ncbi:MAG: SpoIIE family protein phosphatase [Pirellulales bacterium]
MNPQQPTGHFKPRPIHGLKRLGRLTCRTYQKPHSGNRGGDLLVRHRFPDGSYAVLVGDVTGHGEPAALLGKGVPALFRSLCAKLPPPVDIEDLKWQLDAELEKIMPDGINVHAVLIYVNAQSNGVVHPKSAVVGPAPLAPPTRALARTAFLLGEGIERFVSSSPGDVLQFPFAPAAELVVATDGLFDQSGDQPQTHFDKVKQNIQQLPPDKTLFSQLLYAHEQDLKANHHVQDDDVLVVSLRPSTDEEQLVFGLREGQGAAIDQFERLLRQRFTKSIEANRPDWDHLDDVVQELVFHLYTKIREFRHGRLDAWIAVCTGNFLKSRWRNKAKKPLAAMDTAKTDELGATSVVAIRVDDPAQLAALKDFQNYLNKAIANQPEPIRQFLTAVLNRGDATFSEVFESLGIEPHVGKRWLREFRKVIYPFLK